MSERSVSPHRLTVVIPARNEAAVIGAALHALGTQRDLHGAPLCASRLDVIVVANDCDDATADIARQAGALLPIRVDVVSRRLQPQHAHVGAARRFGLDLAAARAVYGERLDDWIASTDADTVVAPDWAAHILREAARADAVAGDVAIGTADRAQLMAPMRIRYARERRYRALLATLEGLLDPVVHDPLPRHGSFVGASFAVRARTYLAAGGLPALPALEDLALCRSLRRIDARIRFSLDVRAATSARTDARVAAGFGAFIRTLASDAERGAPMLVEHPDDVAARYALRAELRTWRRDGSAPPDAVAALDAATRERIIDTPTLGRAYELACDALLPAPRSTDVTAAIERLRTLVSSAIPTWPIVEETGA